LRDAVRKRVEETTLRVVADEVGMTYSGVRSFINGTEPQRGTVDKLVRWYYARSKPSAAPPREDVDTAIAVVRSYIRDSSKPRAIRERLRREVIDRLTED
jgi:hypothetical protein